MKDLKSRLLAPECVAHPIKLLGTDVFIRRLSAMELSEFEGKAAELSGPGTTGPMMKAASSFVLSSLVDENGLPAQDLPTPDELMKVHSYASITEAMSTLQRFSYGSLEEAKKN
ncbi:phage tail protein [Kluyvera ascorbata]|uniref:phage tail protein n=1 Tax=Kluyvera ascorbata TaxID=51288 RepID=UPI002AB994E3|nr:phage tail protein [Kluyvera ascorbata]MDZ4030191.1 phage tail protein [Kluyvera ascorbata]